VWHVSTTVGVGSNGRVVLIVAIGDVVRTLA